MWCVRARACGKCKQNNSKLRVVDRSMTPFGAGKRKECISNNVSVKKQGDFAYEKTTANRFT